MKKTPFLFLIFTLVGALLIAQPTQAVSIYDDVIVETIYPLRVYNQANNAYQTVDNAFDLGLNFANATTCSSSSINDRFEDALTAIQDFHDYAFIANMTYSSGGAAFFNSGVSVYINMQDTSPIDYYWTETTVGVEYAESDILVYNLYYQSGSYCVNGSTIGDSYSIASNDPPNYSRNTIIETNLIIEYPEDYDGIEIEPATPPETELDYIVNFEWSNSPNHITASYTFKTTNPVSSLADPEVIWWHVYSDPNEGDGVAYNETHCDIELRVGIALNTIVHCDDWIPDPNITYFLVAEVNPNSNPDIDDTGYDITFKRTVYQIDMSTSSIGTTESCEGAALGPNEVLHCYAPEQISFVECFQSDFPFVDLAECGHNFDLLFKFLLFGGISFPNWTHSPQCSNLNTFDDWLNLPSGFQVCPLFPSEVRTVVTPFVGFMLGIVTIGFINRHNKDV